jgi:hypothetical protein
MATFWAYILCTAFFGSGLMRVVTYEGGRWRTPISFDHGYVLVWNDPLDDAFAHAGTIGLYAPDGHKLYDTPLTGPAGVTVSVVSGAIDVDGTVAAVYDDEAKPRTRGIALIDSNGTAASFFNPAPYLPGHLCFAQDGSIWTNGTWTTGYQTPPVTGDFMTVRKYSRGGGPIGAYLPLSDLSTLYDASYRRPFDQRIGGWRIRTAKDRIGMVAHVLPVEQWLEIDLDGKLLGRWDFSGPDLKVRAFTSSAAVYGQLPRVGDKPALVLLDKATGKWNPTGATPNGVLLAADGEDLVFRMTDSPGNLLVWVRMRAQWASH